MIVGSAITRPGVIAAKFARALSRPHLPVPAIGVDIGGTSIKAGLVQRNGEVCFTAQTPTDACQGSRSHCRRPDARGRAKCSQPPREAVSSRRVSALPRPAPSTIATAASLRPPTIFPDGPAFNCAPLPKSAFICRPSIVNDAQAAVLSELHFGVGRGLLRFRRHHHGHRRRRRYRFRG